ncbi:MAG: hypothetical protein U1E06_08460 [Tabrizicola sp.]|nr:hypothetical protein [Tabrizicola sp.]
MQPRNRDTAIETIAGALFDERVRHAISPSTNIGRAVLARLAALLGTQG